MKRILLAAGLGLGILSFVVAGATENHATAPHNQLVYDTVPDTTQPAPQPAPDTTTKIISVQP